MTEREFIPAANELCEALSTALAHGIPKMANQPVQLADVVKELADSLVFTVGILTRGDAAQADKIMLGTEAYMAEQLPDALRRAQFLLSMVNSAEATRRREGGAQ